MNKFLSISILSNVLCFTCVTATNPIQLDKQLTPFVTFAAASKEITLRFTEADYSRYNHLIPASVPFSIIPNPKRPAARKSASVVPIQLDEQLRPFVIFESAAHDNVKLRLTEDEYLQYGHLIPGDVALFIIANSDQRAASAQSNRHIDPHAGQIQDIMRP